MRTAWFGGAHPAEKCSCSNCGAPAGSPCRSVIPFAGRGMVGARLTGMHAERLATALAKWGA